VTSSATGYVKYGDVNMDDTVDSVELALLKAYLLAKSSTLPNVTAADVTGDGTLDALDYAILKKYLLGLITTLPADSADSSDKILIPHES
jgi:hypothetical protein